MIDLGYLSLQMRHAGLIDYDRIAKCLIAAAMMYAQERGRDTTRYRFNAKSLSELFDGVAYVREEHVDKLADALSKRGWLFIRESLTHCAVIRADRTHTWPTLGTSRLQTTMQLPDERLDEWIAMDQASRQPATLEQGDE